MREILRRVQVNIPFTMLWETYLERVIARGINPEIGVDAEALERFTPEQFAAVARKLHRCGLRVTLHGPFWDLSAGSPDPEIRALTRRRLEQLLDVVTVFEPLTVVCHAGYDRRRYESMREKWFRRSLETWQWLAGRIEAAGSRLMLENVYEEKPDEIQGFFTAGGDGRIGFCLDTGHLAAFGRRPLSDWLEALGPVVGEVHLHDNHGRRDEHLGLGQGAIDFAPLLAFLQARRENTPVVTLEPHREDDLWSSLGYLRRVWA